MEDLKQIVAENITRLRTAANLTQAELGSMVNYSDKSISKWERAEGAPDIYVLKRLADFYDVSVDALLSGEEEPPMPQSFSVKETHFNYFSFCWIGVVGCHICLFCIQNVHSGANAPLVLFSCGSSCKRGGSCCVYCAVVEQNLAVYFCQPAHMGNCNLSLCNGR